MRDLVDVGGQRLHDLLRLHGHADEPRNEVDDVARVVRVVVGVVHDAALLVCLIMVTRL